MNTRPPVLHRNERNIAGWLMLQELWRRDKYIRSDEFKAWTTIHAFFYLRNRP